LPLFLPPHQQLLKFLLLNGQKSNIERERHGQSFLRFGSTEKIREGMGIDNRMVGYVFLVDKKGRMRWRYVGRGRGEGECARAGECQRFSSSYFPL